MAYTDLLGINLTDRILTKLHKFIGNKGMEDKDILENEILVFLKSPERHRIIKSYDYYRNDTDIKHKKRMLGDTELKNRSNVKRKHPIYRKFVNQKVGYLLSKAPSITTNNEEYQKVLDEVFDKTFLKQFSRVGKNAILGGKSFMYVFIDNNQKIKFKVYNSHTFKPFYADDEHLTVLGGARIYKTIEYVNKQREIITKVEEYTQQGVNYYELEGNYLKLDTSIEEPHKNYLKIEGKEYNWPIVPIVPFRYNEEEQPLLDFVKDGIDIYNLISSSNADLIIDIPLLVFILKGYGGADIKTFVRDLNDALAIKMENGGDIDTLQNSPDIDATEKTLERLRAELYEAASAVDMQQASLGNDSGQKVKMRYADLDTDCNLLEEELQASFQELVKIVNMAIRVTTGKDYSNESVTLTLNRDIIINEESVIQMVRDSVGILDDKTIRENHPWYTSEVEDRLNEQEEDEYSKTFNTGKETKLDGKEEEK